MIVLLVLLLILVNLWLPCPNTVVDGFAHIVSISTVMHNDSFMFERSEKTNFEIKTLSFADPYYNERSIRFSS